MLKKDAGLEVKTEDPEQLCVGDNPNFDMSRYINQYVGITRIRRLMFIGKRTNGELRLTAFRQAIDETRKTINYSMYEKCVTQAEEVLGSGKLGDQYSLNHQWIDQTRRSGHAIYTNFDAILKKAKHIGEREPIREAYFKVADHQMRQGEFQKALSNYMDAKDYGVSPQHKMQVSLSVIKAAIALGSFTQVKVHALRVQDIIRSNALWKSKVSASLGLFYLKTGNFHSAATQFLNCTIGIGTSYNHLISLKDIAIYGSLCALASYDRKSLKRMLDSENWKKFLEIVPIWKLIIQDFVNSLYAQCFEKLERQKNNMLLDMYISPYFYQIDKKIRDRAVQQYFRPFKSVKLPSMALALNMEVADIERYLVQLIADNQVHGRIDSHNKILYSRVADQRSRTYQESIDLGNRYVRDVKSLLMRMSLIKEDFVVRASPKPRRGLDMLSLGNVGGNRDMMDDEKFNRNRITEE